MLDLKAKLLAAGVVTEKQIKNFDQNEEQKRERNKKNKSEKQKKKRGRAQSSAKNEVGLDEKALWERRIQKLQNAGKSEQYETIRNWVERERLDSPKKMQSEEAERFHFSKPDGGITWITLEPSERERIKSGQAGIIAFMSHNGLSHCVVPREVALDVHQIHPEWLRKLENYDFEIFMAKPQGGEATEARAKAKEIDDTANDNSAPEPHDAQESKGLG